MAVNIRAIANILSQHEVEEKFKISYVQGESYTVHTELYGDVFFKKDPITKLYLSDTNTWEKPKMAFASVTKNRQKFSKSELAGVERAGRLIHTLGHHTKADVIRMIGGHQPQIVNSSVTPKDVNNWFDINGADVIALRGKSKNRPTGSRAQSVTVLNKQDQVIQCRKLYFVLYEKC